MMRVSGKNFVLHVVRPVKPPQLLADFAALVAVLKSSGGVGAQTCGAMAGRIGGVVSRFVIDLCFHVSKICKSATRAAEKFHRPRRVSFGLKNGAGTM